MHPLFPYTTLVRSGGSLPPYPPPGGSQGVMRMQKLLMAGFWLFLLSLPIHAAAQGRPIEGHQNLRLGMSVAEAVAAEPRARPDDGCPSGRRSEEHTSELQSLMRISYAVFRLK